MDIYCKACGAPIEKIYLGIWTHDNYPYNKPDKEILIIY